MRTLVSLASLAIVVISTFLMSPAPVLAEADSTNCLYPTPADRFSITVYADQNIQNYNVTPLHVRNYLNWRADLAPAHPNAMGYTFMVRIRETYTWPSVDELITVASNNPGATWIMGNEGDVVWQDNATPEAYVQGYHSVYTAIKSVDPHARFVINGVAQVSPLRLAWLDRVWDSYLATYGVEIPVDVWNIHTYVANEMHQEWGAEIPPGIDNAVGYSERLGTNWALEARPGASGGTVHRSRTVGARAYFAFRGDWVTIHLATGPDAGIAAIHLDQSTTPVDQVDLFSSTPGTLSRTYTNLPPFGGLLTDRHNVRVQVTGQSNPSSSNTWIRVDAVQAPSTASLPGGRFEDNSPLRANIISSINDHDNIDLIVQQTRAFRQWMADRGQRNKPLINTEYGILMTEDLGFDHQRVRTFMLNSFDTFLNNMVDPALGYPADGNRLLQEWYWFALAVEQFEGRTVHTGLYNANTFAIKPLGVDFANYVQPLHQDYVDLEVFGATVTPYWTIFAGQPSLLRVESLLQNRGNLASGPFDVRVRAGNGSLLATFPFSSLPKRYDPGYLTSLAYDWLAPVTGPRNIRIIADEAGQVQEPCLPNNEALLQVTPPQSTDLALSDLRFEQDAPGAPRRLKVDLRNLGSVGTSASQVQVSFWNGNPDAGGQLIGAETLTAANTTLPVTVVMPWPDPGVGQYQIYARVDPVPEETNLHNNTQQITVNIYGSVAYVPLATYRFRTPRRADHEALAHPLWSPTRAAVNLPSPGQ